MSTDPETIERNLETARQKKVTGDAAFKAGNIPDGGAVASAMKSGSMDAAAAPKERTEADELVEKVYANMSACHVKRENWKRARETAEKALARNPKNYKAMFRRGKALGEQGFFERAERILEELIKESPADAPAATAELKRLRVIDKEKEKVHNQKLRGWLNRGVLETSAADSEVVEEVASPGTKES